MTLKVNQKIVEFPKSSLAISPDFGGFLDGVIIDGDDLRIVTLYFPTR